MEHESDDDTSCNWRTRCSHQRIDKGPGGFGNKRTSWDQPNYSNIKIDQNNEKSLWELRRLKLQWKTISKRWCEKLSKELDNNDNHNDNNNSVYCILASHGGDHWEKSKKTKKREEYLDLARDLKKAVAHESQGSTSCNWCTWSGLDNLGTDTKRPSAITDMKNS